jgi:dTDP-glucose pyrophosphorylase
MPNTILITMAGRGSRFHHAGFSVPKYEIEVRGRSLFDWSVGSLANLIHPDDLVVFVCLAENRSADFVRRRCRALSIPRFLIVDLPEVTDGQATSAYAARAHWQPDAPLFVYNIDTYVNPDYLHCGHIPAEADGWIPCFEPPGDHWSFVKLDEHGWAERFVEKRRISDHATIGLYHFARAADFAHAYERFFCEGSGLVRGEKYIAPMYNQLIQDGKRLAISTIPCSEVHVLGTPEELERFRSEQT